MLKREGNGKNEKQEKKKPKNTGPLSPKKDREPELPGAVILGLVCDWYENAGASGLEK